MRPPPRSTRTDRRGPYTTLVRSDGSRDAARGDGSPAPSRALHTRWLRVDGEGFRRRGQDGEDARGGYDRAAVAGRGTALRGGFGTSHRRAELLRGPGERCGARLRLSQPRNRVSQPLGRSEERRVGKDGGKTCR